MPKDKFWTVILPGGGIIASNSEGLSQDNLHIFLIMSFFSGLISLMLIFAGLTDGKSLEFKSMLKLRIFCKVAREVR